MKVSCSLAAGGEPGGRTIGRAARSAILVLTTLVLASCDVLGLQVGDSPRSELERQRSKWARQQITAYRFTYRRDCFCGAEFIGPMEIEVLSGGISAVRYTERNDPVPVSMVSTIPTVDGLFGIIADAIDRRADVLDVTYDHDLGHPTRISIDHRFNIADDEIVHIVLDLDVVPQEVTPQAAGPPIPPD